MMPQVEIVVKMGGALLKHPNHFDGVLEVVGAAVQGRRLLVVPGGGAFADTVRDIDRTFPLSHAAAHWMAVLAMDQYAHLIVSRLGASAVVSMPSEIAAAFDSGVVPVLAPSSWLRERDPLPHSWDVTSDSIAAWVAGAVGARTLVLVKPPGATGNSLVDPYFGRALPARVGSVVIPADCVGQLREALGGGPGSG
jgi:5-(aminomethyl)-3-furanmethanol phosphate kinase